MRLRTGVVLVVMTTALVVYAGLVGLNGVLLVSSGDPVGVPLGLAVIVIPLLGIGLAVRELQFGRACSKMAALLEAEGGLPVDDLPRRPSGRVDRGAADARFEQMRVQTEAAPDDWRSWFRLALAYDAAGDRTRARAAARHAVELWGRAPAEEDG